MAALWMSGALASFSIMAVSVRELHSSLESFQILAFRSFISLIILAAVLQVQGWFHLKTTRIRLHTLRNTIHFVGQYSWVYALGLIPLAEVFAIEFTTPIWAAILAMILLGEQFNRYRAAAIILGFLGILVILRPGLITISEGSLWVLLASWAFAGTFICTKKLTATEGTLAILFFMNLMQLPMALIPAIPNWIWPEVSTWPYIIAVALSGLGAHVSITMAMRYGDVSIIAPMDFLRLPLIALVGWWLYNEALDYFVLIGGVLIFLGTFINIRGELGRAKETAAKGD